MARNWVIVAAVNGFIAVAAGAFGAHALKTRLDPKLLETFDVGARYQMYHALALLATAWLIAQYPSRTATASGYCFAIGIVVFSGSLYALSLSGVRWLGAITPIGGTLFLVGWLLLAWAGGAIRSAS
jgi:uncharacterized membrane protein YgdD (TMEM256/DUF423 family)